MKNAIHRARWRAGLWTIAAACAGVAIILGALFAMQSFLAGLNTMYAKNLEPMYQLDSIRAAQVDIGRMELRIVAQRDTAYTWQAARRIADRLDAIDSIWMSYDPRGIANDEEARLASAVRDALPPFRQRVERFSALALSGDYERATLIVLASEVPRMQMEALMAQIIQVNLDGSAREYRRGEQLFERVAAVGIALFVIGLVAVLVALYRMNRHRDSALRDSRYRGKLAEQITEHSPNSAVVTDASGTIVHVNAAFCAITGYSAHEVLGQNPRLWRSGRQSPDFYKAMWQSLTTAGQWSGEIWNRRKDGELFLMSLNIAGIRGHDGNFTSYIGIGSDVTHRRTAEDRLGHMAMHDALTGIPNRVLFDERLRHSISRAQANQTRLGVMFVDLDGFKSVNDNHGHMAGDAVLVCVASRLRAAVRESDTVARLSGDEFAVLIEDIREPMHLGAVAESLLAAVVTPVQIGRHAIGISASIGISVYPEDAVEARQLLEYADRAMYAAKKSGKRAYRFHAAPSSAPDSAGHVIVEGSKP
ncbi:diguanylate cyclase domain-containing protein [Uliginosibacterium sp. sgz301328]|uniref:diguanylate cyclase domain-containing protein n=1 Tax=Uliginosibacterium sp. sgz301328 TaxID=3243764 RepID=UPI00359D5F32